MTLKVWTQPADVEHWDKMAEERIWCTHYSGGTVVEHATINCEIEGLSHASRCWASGENGGRKNMMQSLLSQQL
jgi:hypothetical protein